MIGKERSREEKGGEKEERAATCKSQRQPHDKRCERDHDDEGDESSTDGVGSALTGRF